MLSRRTSKPTAPVVYPLGTFCSTERGYFYIGSGTDRYHLITERVVASWRPLRVVETTEAALSKYKVNGRMKFRNGSLLHSLADGKIFLVESGKRRHVLSPDALSRIGAVRKEAVTVSLEELQLHEIGEVLT